MKKQEKSALTELLEVMARLRAPDGCPWDQAQNHRSIRFHTVEEAYELLDAIEADDDHEMLEELGDLLLQVVFHCQMASERGAFDFERVARVLVEKLVRRHPHVFGEVKVKDVDAVWAQWEQIKRAEKKGTRHDRPSVLDGIPRHLPALLRVEKLVKKARKAHWVTDDPKPRLEKEELARRLFELAAYAQSRGWSAEALVRGEAKQRERRWRTIEKKASAKPPTKKAARAPRA